MGKSVFRQTKELCLTLKRDPGENNAKFASRVLAKRDRFYSENFEESPRFNLAQSDFICVCKVIDDKISNWRKKEDKETCLLTFSIL